MQIDPHYKNYYKEYDYVFNEGSLLSDELKLELKQLKACL